MITDKRFDNGNGFDWGKTSEDYAKYRDIYPQEFYEKIHSMGLCTKGQNVLDLGTGTGVLPRNMYHYGAKFTGTDISESQIKYAKMLSENAGMDIDYYVRSAENSDFPDNSFDVITACQCYFYFNHKDFAPIGYKMLKKGGNLVFLYLAWLPLEDEVARKSEELILKYNPDWTGCGETRHLISVPQEYLKYFNVSENFMCDVDIPFTVDSWNGRMKACRGVEASMSSENVELFEKEHLDMLRKYNQNSFNIKHYYAMLKMTKK